MNNFNRIIGRMAGSDLQRVIEPLASYICAADKPQTALMSALAVLLREVESTNQAALAHFQSCLQN
jgi:hypothetical protein